MHGDVVSDDVALAGVKKEILRSLPYWKSFVELREAYRRRPRVAACDVVIESRMACSHFVGVDVLWVRSDVVLVNWRRPTKRSRTTDVPPECVEVHLSFGSMHFVHQNAHVVGGARSYDLQSVVWLQRPEQLQCVAGNMVHFAFLVYGMLHFTPEAGSVAAPHAILPPPTAAVLVLGMGGNSMEWGLRYVLGEEAHIYIAEVEPAVVGTCRMAGLLKENANTHLSLCSADEAIRKCPEKCTFVFMDLFEPLSGTMVNTMPLIQQVFDLLEPAGILLINEHSIPTTEHLLPLLRQFGDHNVQYINVRGCNESIIAAVKPGSSTDGLGCRCSKKLAEEVLNVFGDVFPGWMPGKEYIKRTNVLYAKPNTLRLRARQWTS
ncbi:uncharacterized protein Tco025E_02936 [Trypanosoma conorhini]|uniref:Uncharacterized protein n=1 Tax=Trypanosoma conorhini TaxID=83891 RepID=A0A3R7NT04_9TRYP|nr:uncharacterized protein Tco025E_02936 [Trypanosoma conorhini]RNF23025.1 hypothetical protein Tco025E_02936 [Trypanosoma conorhini]